MRRGEIRLVDFDPARGSEASKRRPAVLVSNDHANASAERLMRGVVTVVPLRSNTAQCEQICSVSVDRIGNAVGELPAGLLASIDDALRVHLAL